MKHLNITLSQWWVLCGIPRDADEGITQTMLATDLNLGKVALGGLIDRLEERGFVERHPDEIDRRINRISLTRKGEAILDRMKHVGVDINAKVMKDISFERQDTLGEILDYMKANLVSLK